MAAFSMVNDVIKFEDWPHHSPASSVAMEHGRSSSRHSSQATALVPFVLDDVASHQILSCNSRLLALLVRDNIDHFVTCGPSLFCESCTCSASPKGLVDSALRSSSAPAAS